MESIAFKKTQTDTDIQKLVEFLTTCAVFDGNGQFFTNSGTLPLSYYSTLDYWGDYICNTWAKQNGQDCTVSIQDFGDGTDQHPYYRNGGTSPGSQLQIERVNACLGTDIYDAACWQIALALIADRGLQGFTPSQIFTLVSFSTQRLLSSVKAVRANTDNFQYGYQQTINDPREAYALRLIGKDYWAQDPLWDTDYEHYISHWPPCDRTKPGTISWADWKPITGENAWAFLIGPLQADYFQFKAQGYIPFQSDSIQNALYILYAFQSMQCAIGSLYYAPGGSEGNVGPIPQGEISVENNASFLAGLIIFKHILEAILSKDGSLTSDDQAKVKAAINLISIMIWGGKLPSGQTAGLLKFFQTNAWNAAAGIFYQGGTYNNGVWTPSTSSNAVDVNTWGLTVLGPDLLDRWFGAGTSFNIWQSVKSWGSFSQNGQLWGMGYSNLDNNAIMSAEWTAGAINAVRCLMIYYQSDAAKLSSLQADHDAMMENLLNLRTDKYVDAGFPDGLEAHFFNDVNPPTGLLAFLYASKRYSIPFGWYANPIPSTTSTSWAIFLHYDYNPFQLGGSYESLAWSTPAYDTNDDTGPWNAQGTVINLTVQNKVDGAEIMPSYQASSTSGWQNLLQSPIPVKGTATIQLPRDAAGFMVTYHKPDMSDWLRACLLAPSTITDLQSGQTITAVWTNDAGDGTCRISS
ncbi:MAG: hypothetical protein KME07_05635 [Pegethrix bostrychoides GSE-TBD4-15B]|jgi:hypothetical protein|uniref:Uncharacterized protein n=1 Tax=Pegethrix bostrychoides GSE-TBD4-15B TaxID=2839662 RepID=A0A951P8G3_9CYAN|nr:hypothetical protein [Pegethrix bostrychoides GSE-TBD4-15B]